MTDGLLRYGNLEIGKQYAKKFLKRADGSQDYTLDQLARSPTDRTLLVKTFTVLVDTGRLTDLDKMGADERKAVWDFAMPYCKMLSKEEIQDFIKSMLAIGILLPA